MSDLIVGRHVGDGQISRQSLDVSESSRVLAEVQASLAVAQARPRDEERRVDRIMTACQRVRLAEGAAYSYAKGGTNITGASIRLLECVAQHWGNINFGFRELSQVDGESTVEAFAWDLETNTKRSTTFVVPHKIHTRKGDKVLKDPREIYEYVANQAQRRVRACLENILPRDIIEDALDECEATLKAKADVSPAGIKKMVDAFLKSHGVTKQQIEKRIQRKVSAIEPAQIIALRRIFNSIKDGMSVPSDWFESQPSNADDVADAIKGHQKRPDKPEPVEVESPAGYFDRLSDASTEDEIASISEEVDRDESLSDEEREGLRNLAEARFAEVAG